MPSKRPPALKNKAYVEIDLELLKSTGEVRIIGDPIIAPTMTVQVPRGKFEITYTAELFDIMKELGNKKIEVFSYLLDHKDGNNMINTNMRELAKNTNTSLQTVNDTIKILKQAELLTRKGSVYMVSPALMVKGNQIREAYLMRQFIETSQKTIDSYENSIDAEIDPQYSFTTDGQIVQKARNAKK